MDRSIACVAAQRVQNAASPRIGEFSSIAWSSLLRVLESPYNIMYRRNITHILTPLALGLALLIGYHFLMKPSQTDPSQPASQSSESVVAVAPPPLPPHREPREEEIRSARVLDHSIIPKTEHDKLLESVRDEIEKHNLSLAETKLRELPASVLSNGKVKPFVAILWNNLGLMQERLSGTQASLKAFKRAADLDDANPIILMNLAQAYWEQRDQALDMTFLTRLIRLAPEEPFPHLAMADLLQEHDQLSEAAKHLVQATKLAKKDPGLQSYLATVTAKVKHTESAESRMSTKNSTHFVVKFDGGEDHTTWNVVLEILEEAHREIGQKLGHFPSKPIVVVLHAKDSFQGATESPAWADGLYDPNLGRIQVPTQGATTDMKWLGHVLRHEYIHALLHDRLGRGIGALPTWLNEGLAMQLSGDAWPDLGQASAEEKEAIPLASLHGSWGTLPAGSVSVAYGKANSATHYFIERWGIARVNELLDAFKANASVETALQNTLSISYEQFHQQWLEQLEQRRS